MREEDIGQQLSDLLGRLTFDGEVLLGCAMRCALVPLIINGEKPLPWTTPQAAAISAPPKCHRRIDVIFASHGFECEAEGFALPLNPS